MIIPELPYDDASQAAAWNPKRACAPAFMKQKRAGKSRPFLNCLL
jgi:hypothetical protein